MSLFDDEIYICEQKCSDIIAKNKNCLIPWWIMAAYSYEVLSNPIISDSLFDSICIQIANEWDHITHPHKNLLDRSMIKSSIAINGQWPNIAIHAAKRLISEHK